MWKNFGNNHTVFDASNGTSPTGTAVNNANSAVAWTATYPTLMGWNGTSTYGVRVDSARVADTATNSTQLGGIAAASYAQLASPALTGTPTAPTPTNGDISTKIATTAFVEARVTSAVGGTPYQSWLAKSMVTNNVFNTAGGSPNFCKRSVYGTNQVTTTNVNDGATCASGQVCASGACGVDT